MASVVIPGGPAVGDLVTAQGGVTYRVTSVENPSTGIYTYTLEPVDVAPTDRCER